MKTALLLSMLALATPAIAQAGTFKVPGDAPIASITIPDSWGPKLTKSGIDATSPDAVVYIAADVADGDTMEKVVSDAIDFLSDNGVTIDVSTQRDVPNDKVNGLDMSGIDWDGTDKDGPVSVGIAFVVPKPDKMLVITYWASKAQEQKHLAEVGGILASIKRAK